MQTATFVPLTQGLTSCRHHYYCIAVAVLILSLLDHCCHLPLLPQGLAGGCFCCHFLPLLLPPQQHDLTGRLLLLLDKASQAADYRATSARLAPLLPPQHDLAGHCCICLLLRHGLAGCRHFYCHHKALQAACVQANVSKSLLQGFPTQDKVCFCSFLFCVFLSRIFML